MECDKKYKFKNYLKFTYEMTAAVGEDNGNDNACIFHLLDEKLDSNKPSKPYPLCPKTLEKVNSQPIAYFINKVLNVLYPIQQMTKMFFCADMLHHICLLFMLMG
jgi:hypothetical protein